MGDGRPSHPPSILLAIPATIPPSIPSPLPSTSVPLPSDPELAHLPMDLSGSAPAPPASQHQVAPLPSSVEFPPARQPPAVPPAASPAAPPAAPPAPAASPSQAFPPLPSSLSKSPPHAEDVSSVHPADIQIRPQPVRQNAKANPLHPISYAQAAKGSPGPGFVRTHARDVDSFARLPRTGINVIRGSREGIPTFAFVQSDLPKVEGLYSKALVMKFHGGRPSLAASHKEISSWGLESPFSIGPLTSRSFLLRFQEERDLLKTLTRPSSILIKFPYKIFRWHSRCHIKEDSCVVPIWFSLPRLPLQCFAPEFLESIANTIGRFLCLDKATATLARPSEARMCVELDLRKERLQFIWIELFEGFKQPIVYERVPKFCSGCHVLGHTNVDCSKTPLDTLQTQDSGPIPAVQECSHPVRRNVKELLDVVSQEKPHQIRSPPVDAATSHPSASALPLQLPPDPSQQQQLTSPVIIFSEQQPCAPTPPPPSPSFPAGRAGFPAVQQPLQSTVAAATQPPPPPPPSDVKAVPSSAQISAAAVFHPVSDPHPFSDPPTPSKVQSPLANPAAVRSTFLSAQAAPFPPSDPVQSSRQPSSLHNQPSTSSLTVRYNSNGAKYMTCLPPPSHPNRPLWEMVNHHQGNLGHLSPIINAPSPSYNHQFHALEGYESEGSFETDSQPNSPLESHKKDAINCFFPPQSCVSEGDQTTEDHPGFHGHISDVEFYHRPMSSKKNKRQPDGPLRVQLRTRKGPSLHK